MKILSFADKLHQVRKRDEILLPFHWTQKCFFQGNTRNTNKVTNQFYKLNFLTHIHPWQQQHWYQSHESRLSLYLMIFLLYDLDLISGSSPLYSTYLKAIAFAEIYLSCFLTLD